MADIDSTQGKKKRRVGGILGDVRTAEGNGDGNGTTTRGARHEAAEPQTETEHLSTALECLHRGDFSFRLRPRDGVGREVADAFNDLAERLDHSALELARLTRVVGRDGEMGERMRMGGLRGGWETIGDSFNTLIGDLTRPTTEVARVLIAVAEGDLSQKMALEIDGKPVRGEFLCIGMTVNRMVDQLRAFAREMTRVAREVGTEGKLGGQANVPETTERRREELEQANRSKDVFLATLSHELRTPLNATVGWTDMMRNGQLAASELGRAIETIDRNAHALNHLVADLLDVSRIVTGSLKIDSNLVGLASVVEQAIEAARPQCTAKRVVLDVSLERVGCVRGDAGRLRQIIGNLLSNAIKFTPTGGSVIVRVGRVGETGCVVVQDTGEGISPEFLPHVFERFQQAEEAKARGLGLGLAIVKHLVEEQGGTVTASSDGRGLGASFTVSLPIAPDEALAQDVDPGRASVPVSAQPQLAGVHVLVVEDDPDGNELITTILERYGARVTSVGTAADALDALDEEKPDVVVSDIGLPDADGLELIKMIRGRAFGGDVPAIALTAYASRQDAAKAIAAGFDAHVAKPVQPCILGAAVARLVASGRAGATASQGA